MAPSLTDIIVADDPAVRNRSLDSICDGLDLEGLLREYRELEAFRRKSENLYERVRAIFFLHAIHRFHLPKRIPEGTRGGSIPFRGYEHLLNRRF